MPMTYIFCSSNLSIFLSAIFFLVPQKISFFVPQKVLFFLDFFIVRWGKRIMGVNNTWTERGQLWIINNCRAGGRSTCLPAGWDSGRCRRGGYKKLQFCSAERTKHNFRGTLVSRTSWYLLACRSRHRPPPSTVDPQPTATYIGIAAFPAPLCFFY